jgi:hypothetical protein
MPPLRHFSCHYAFFRCAFIFTFDFTALIFSPFSRFHAIISWLFSLSPLFSRFSFTTLPPLFRLLALPILIIDILRLAITLDFRCHYAIFACFHISAIAAYAAAAPERRRYYIFIDYIAIAA